MDVLLKFPDTVLHTLPALINLICIIFLFHDLIHIFGLTSQLTKCTLICENQKFRYFFVYAIFYDVLFKEISK